LGPVAELELRSGLTASYGSLLPLFTRPVSLIFILLALIVPFIPLMQEARRKKRLAFKNGRPAG